MPPFFFFFCKTRRGKTALGTSAYEKSQRNEDILAVEALLRAWGGVGGWFSSRRLQLVSHRAVFGPDLISLA